MTDEPRETLADASFTCAVCGAAAGTVRIVRTETGADVQGESWLGLASYPFSAGEPVALRWVLPALDARRLFELNFELAPFYCPTCDASYCGGHWTWWDVWDEEWRDWRDSVRGRCPHGHERMLQD